MADRRTSWIKRNKQKHAAHSAVYRALKRGTLIKVPCHCGAIKVESHHEDYSKPLEVIWQDSEGKNKSKIEIVVENFQFLSAGKSEDSSGKPNSSKPEPVPSFEEANPFDDGSIPF